MARRRWTTSLYSICVLWRPSQTYTITQASPGENGDDNVISIGGPSTDSADPIMKISRHENYAVYIPLQKPTRPDRARTMIHIEGNTRVIERKTYVKPNALVYVKYPFNPLALTESRELLLLHLRNVTHCHSSYTSISPRARMT